MALLGLTPSFLSTFRWNDAPLSSFWNIVFADSTYFIAICDIKFVFDALRPVCLILSVYKLVVSVLKARAPWKLPSYFNSD